MRKNISRSRQRGVAILLLVVLLAGAGIAVLVTYLRASPRSIASDAITAPALAQAREALIGRAVSATNRPGSLPCPDTDNDGLENWNVGVTACASYVGRLPWRTLGLPQLKDGSGETLWYALSPNFRDHASIQPLNSDSVGQLTITGTSPLTAVIAIIFAPGEVLGTQIRGSANVNDVTRYLEGENGNGDLIFTASPTSSTFNDQLLTVTSQALFSVVANRVALEARKALESYRTTNGYYPWASEYIAGSPYACKVSVPDGRIPLAMQPGCGSIAEWAGQLPAWFSANNWNLVTHYGMNNACTLTVTGFTTAGCTVVIVSGRALGVQTRPCLIAADCLEDAENRNGDSIYVKPSRYPTSNDRMAVICAAASPCAAVP